MVRIISRREFLGTGAAFATVVALTGCSVGDSPAVSEYAAPDVDDGSDSSTDATPDTDSGGSDPNVVAIYAAPDVEGQGSAAR